MGDPVYDIGVGLASGILLAIIFKIVDNHLRITHGIQKILNWESPCQFTFSSNIKVPKVDFIKILIETFRNNKYSVDILEKGYRTRLRATKENLESYNITILKEDPINISIDPVQTTVRSAPSRLSSIASILQKAKDDSGSTIESASLEVVLPYNVGVDIRVPRNMKLSNYNIEIMDNDVKVILRIGNSLGLHSSDFIQLIETYRKIL